jgi:hypothetical protein
LYEKEALKKKRISAIIRIKLRSYLWEHLNIFY